MWSYSPSTFTNFHIVQLVLTDVNESVMALGSPKLRTWISNETCPDLPWDPVGSMQWPGLFVELLGNSMDGHQPGIQEGQLFTILELGGPSLETCC